MTKLNKHKKILINSKFLCKMKFLKMKQDLKPQHYKNKLEKNKLKLINKEPKKLNNFESYK